jgi:predicted alpha/beta-fold hydrolase
MYTHHLDSLKQFQGTLLSSLNDQIIGLKNPKLIDVDELVVSQTGGPSPPWPFKSACDYYAYASSDRALPGIRVPFLAISADDDPIVRVIPKPDEAGTDASEWVAVVVTPGGGHLGWFEDGKRRGEVTRWVKQPVLQWVQALVDEFVKEGKQGARETEEVDGFIREVGRPNIGFKEVGEEDLPKGPNVQGLTTGL